MSEVPQVFAAISAVMGEMAKDGIGKNRKNQTQNYSFRGIDDVYNALSSVLAENKLVMLPFVRDMQREERTTKQGGILNYTILTVDFTLGSAVDGSTATVRMIGEAMDSADKSSNKAQSAALKYAALQVFMIPTEGDNDADAITHEVQAKEAQQPAPKRLSQSQWAKIVQLIEATSQDTSKILAYYKVDDLKKMTDNAAIHCINGLEEKLAKIAAKTSLADELNDEIGF